MRHSGFINNRQLICGVFAELRRWDFLGNRDGSWGQGRIGGRLAGVVCRRQVVDAVIKEAMGVWRQWARRIALSNKAEKNFQGRLSGLCGPVSQGEDPFCRVLKRQAFAARHLPLRNSNEVLTQHDWGVVI